MTSSDDNDSTLRRGRKIRVPFRRNRSKPARVKDWTRQAREAEDHEIETHAQERVAAKGQLSRHRTVIVDAPPAEGLQRGVVVALRGQFCEVDDGDRVWLCTVRRVLRTRFAGNRNPLAAGDIVWLRPAPERGSRKPGSAKIIFATPRLAEPRRPEGVIESVEDRRGQLRRKVGRRVQTMVANVDQVIIVRSTADPPPKPHLIDRYIVATLAGNMAPVICMNKMDLLPEGGQILQRYERLGYKTLATCAITEDGVDRLREILPRASSAVVGQSGVGKTALLNAVQPGLGLRVAEVIPDSRKGRHTTSTATLIRLAIGGYVVDTPGVRSLDLSPVNRFELEEHFIELADHVAQCKFPDCTHTHEHECAVKKAVDDGLILGERYESYKRLFEELS